MSPKPKHLVIARDSLCIYYFFEDDSKIGIGILKERRFVTPNVGGLLGGQ